MKIIILIPIWRRPELTRKCIQALRKLKPKGVELLPVMIISNTDPDYSMNCDTCWIYKCSFSLVANKPLGFKKYIGLKDAVDKYFDYDYIMELGSDDFINPKLFDLYDPDLYDPFMSEGVKFFGLNNLYMYSVKQDKLIWVKEYAGEEMTYGAGRMIHRSVIEKIGCNLWDDYNEGLDTTKGRIS